eukprot:scaffold659350_cov88-Prasinocladus_malaysianus.AAC.1
MSWAIVVDLTPGADPFWCVVQPVRLHPNILFSAEGRSIVLQRIQTDRALRRFSSAAQTCECESLRSSPAAAEVSL